MLPAKIAGLLPDHDVTTVKQAGFTGLDNGELINRAVTAGYTVLVTADAEQIDAVIRETRPGTVVRVTR